MFVKIIGDAGARQRNYMKCEVPTVVSVTAPLTLLPCPNAMQDIHRPRNTRPQNKREN